MYIILSGINTTTDIKFDPNNKNIIIKCTNPKGDVVDVYLSPDQVKAAYEKLVENKFGWEK